MKLKSYLMAFAALAFAACQQDDTPAMQEQEQVLRIATRSTSDEGATEAFTDDFTLVLSSTTDNTKHETHSVTYTDDNTGWNAIKSSILPAHAFAYKGSSVTGIAYAEDKWNYTVTLQTDQTDATKLAAADVMTATGNATAGTTLNLNFAHHFAKVTFNATLASEFGDTDYIQTVDVNTADDNTVNAYVDGKTVSAIVTAGTYTAGDDFLSITVSDADEPLTVKVPTGGLTFNAGTHYTFALKVGKDKVTLTPGPKDIDFPDIWDNDSEVDLK